jgi:hypothetical protein
MDLLCNSSGGTGTACRNFSGYPRPLINAIICTCSFQSSFQIILINYVTFLSVELDGTLFLFINILLH